MTKAGGKKTSSAKQAQVADDSNPLQKQLRILENKLIAQKWDIEGLTAQRDEALEAHASLSVEVERLKREAAGVNVAHRSLRLDEAWIENTALRVGSKTALSVVDSPSFVVFLADPRNAPLVTEVMIIALSGLFDLEFYERSANEHFPDTLQAILHYLRGGDRAGLSPHPLFQPDFYSLQIERLGLSRKSSFRSRLGHYLKLGVARRASPCIMFDVSFYDQQIGQEALSQYEPLAHYLTIGRLSNLRPHPLFDPDYYTMICPIEIGDADPLTDFLTRGIETDISPHRLFDAGFYVTTYTDVKEVGVNPFIHYLLYGDAEERQPNPLFDVSLYRQLYGDSIPSSMTALAYYVLMGRKVGALRTHLLFDGDFYRRRYRDVDSYGHDPLFHFLEYGYREMRLPHPLFNIEYLLYQVPQLLRTEPNPIRAYLGSDARFSHSPAPGFDLEHYCRQSPEARKWNEGPLLHYLRFGAEKALSPHSLFDPKYYGRELERAGITIDARDSLHHFLTVGFRRGFSPHPLFDVKFYEMKYRDIAQSGINPWEHFLLFGGGIGERRQPHILFDIAFYARRYGDRVPPGRNLLLDYLASPIDEGRVPHPLFDPFFYSTSDADALEYTNPLVDYVAKGRHARRQPHPLFDPVYYESHVDVPADWHRTLLEHYCAHPEAAQILPHPAMDTAYLLECQPNLAGGPVNFLRHYLDSGEKQSIDPSPAFDSISYRFRYPELAESGEDPLVHYLRTGGQAWWTEPGPAPDPPISAKKRAREKGDRISAFQRLETIDDPSFALLDRYLADEAILHCRSDVPPCRDGGGSLTIVAARSTQNDALPGISELVQSIATTNDRVIFVAETEDPHVPSDLPEAASIIVRPPGGGPMASWMLGLSLTDKDVGSFDRVIFVDDRLVGPIDDIDTLYEQIIADKALCWWQPYKLPKSAREHCPPIMAFNTSVVTSDAFRSFQTTFIYPSGTAAGKRSSQPDLAETLLRGGIDMQTLLSLTELKDRWERDISDRIDWFSTLPGRLGEVGLADIVPTDLVPPLIEYAENWYRRMLTVVLTRDDFDPGLLFGETIIADGRFPFLRRDLLLRNPMKSPEILRLPSLLSSKAWTKLKEHLYDDLPAVTSDIPMLLRLTRTYFNA